MNLGIHDARQDMEACTVNNLTCAICFKSANFSNAPVAYTKITLSLSLLVNHSSSFQDQIERRAD